MHRALAVLVLLTTSLSPAAALHCEMPSEAAHAHAAEERVVEHGPAGHQGGGGHHGHPASHDRGTDAPQHETTSDLPEGHGDCRLVMACGFSMIRGRDVALTTQVPSLSGLPLPDPVRAPTTAGPASEPPPPRLG